LLTGDGGDELFAGYEKYRGFVSAPDFIGVSDANFSARYWPRLTLFSDTEKAELLGRNACELPHSRRLIDRISEENAHQDIINRMLLIDIQLLLPGNNLVKSDRMSMSASIEARSPFLDYRMVEFALRTSGAMKLEGMETKSCMKRAVLNRLGPELTYRTKQMFTVPVGDWFKNTRREYCRVMLDSLKETGWVKSEFVDKIFDEHLANKVNRTRELRALVALQLWRSEFLSCE
jgi:asparagine synthase (glutamine-hydrolysing)